MDGMGETTAWQAQLAAAPGSTAQALAQDAVRMAAVRRFADNVLREGRDCYRAAPTPLFANAIDVRSKAHLRWTFPASGEDAGGHPGRSAVLCNVSCQQNLMRCLVALTRLTGLPQYQAAACDATRYFVRHYQDDNGLLRWGGHQFIDLATLDVVGPDEKNGVHELKNAFPYYDLLFDVAPTAAARFIQAFWNAHVYDWATLEIGRHGDYARKIDGQLWHDQPFTPLPPYAETKGLSFLNAGNDLIYAGAIYAQRTGDAAALRWVRRLIEQFVAARDPLTRLGAYQFSQPRKTAEAPDDASTYSWYGDRAQRQLGPEFEPHPPESPRLRRVLEARVLVASTATTVYSESALMQCQIAHDMGGDLGQQMLAWAEEGLAAFAHYAYRAEDNLLRPLLAGGEDLSFHTLPRDGYYGKRGEVLKPYPAGSNFLLSYARAYLLTGNEAIWKTTRAMAEALGLGDLGEAPGRAVAIDRRCASADPLALFAVLDLYRQSAVADYLLLARLIGNNIVRTRFVAEIDGMPVGYFMTTPTDRYASFDAIEGYALLALEAAIRGDFSAVPPFVNGSGYTEGAHQMADGGGRTITDKRLLALKSGEPLV